jgi:Flp pilus assembly protein TadB
MLRATIVLVILIGAGLLLHLVRNFTIRQQALGRLSEGLVPAPADGLAALPSVRMRPFARRYRGLPWLLGLATGLGLYFLAHVGWMFSVALGLIVLLLGTQLANYLVERRRFLIEMQLADAIDLMISALRAGVSVQRAIEVATDESPRPLQPQLAEVIARIRYGDAPRSALQGLMDRVPLESFRLFTSALIVHWQVGGSLAPTLASVGKIIRDRVETARRIRGSAMQARLSTLLVLLVIYFIAFIMWRNDPDRMRQFLSTAVGQGLAAITILLQALGILWSARMSRMSY